MDIGLGVVLGLIELVTDGVLGSGGTGAEAGIVVLSDVLVGLLGSGSTSSLDSLSDVVGGVLVKRSQYIAIQDLKEVTKGMTNLDSLHFE